MTHPSDDDRRLDDVLRKHAARLPVPSELRRRILESTPDRVRRLDAVLHDARRISIPAGLSQRILAAAPAGGLRELAISLWPFGSVWRPAAALIVIAALGIVLGATEAASLHDEVSINGALSEEVFVLAQSVNGPDGSEDLEWLE